MSESTELTLPERASVALGAPKYEQEIRELVAQSVTIIEIKNKDAREQCHGALMMLKGTRVAIEKAAKAAREDATAFSKAVIAEEKRLVAISEPEETRLQGLRDVWDAEREAERQAKAEAEAQRIRNIKGRIERFMLDAVTASDGTAAEIDAHATRLSETVISLDEFFEFAGEAQLKRDDTVKWLRERQQQAAERETEARRLAEERAELERLRAEQAERERVAAAARAAQEQADREARAAEEARQHAERERVEAEQRAAREKAEAAMRAEREAHEARIKAEREALEREQAALAAERRRHIEEAEAARLEHESKVREAQERAAAEALARQIEVDHVEGIAENARIDAHRAEMVRAISEREAVEAERIRREQVEFETNGPGDVEIVETLAKAYGVSEAIVAHWLAKFDSAPFIEPMEEAA